MKNHSHQYGVNAQRKIFNILSFGWHSIKKKNENNQKQVIITQNKRRILTVIIFLLSFLFLMTDIMRDNYLLFMAVVFLIISGNLSSFYNKITIIRNISNSSIIIKKQTFLKRERDIVYQKEQSPSLKLFKYLQIDSTMTSRFSLVINSSGRMNELSFAKSLFPFKNNKKWYGHIIPFNKKEAENISRFLNIPLLNKIGDIYDTEFQYYMNLNNVNIQKDKLSIKRSKLLPIFLIIYYILSLFFLVYLVKLYRMFI